MTDDRTHRVLVVTQHYPPESLGGAHRWERLARNLPDRYECRVVCPPPSFPFGEFAPSNRPWEREVRDGVPVTRLWTYQPSTDADSAGRMLNYGVFAVLASLYVLVHGRKFDTVVTMSAPHTTFLAGVVGKLLGLVWVVDVFDLWLDNAVDLGYVDDSSLGYRVVSRLERAAMTRSDHVMVVTPTMRRQYQRKYGVPDDRITPVPFGVDRQAFRDADGRADGDRIIYTGNLGEGQAFDPFLEAFARLDDGVELLLVGTGERRAELERECERLGVADRVTFAGVVPRAEIPELLAGSALAWVPLKTDAQLDYARPTKLLEAMATGTPYVASAVAEIAAVTEESGAGVAVPNDPDDIADAMSSLLADDDLRAEMGRRGVEFVERNHRWSALGERVDAVLRAAHGERVEDRPTQVDVPA